MKQILTLSLLLFFGIGLYAQPKAVSEPRVIAKTNESFLNSRLKAAASSNALLQQMIDDFVKEHQSQTAAVSVAVFTNQDVLVEKSLGHINIEENKINHSDAVLEWGSVGKLLVWVSVMQLVEQGLLDLHADIRSYLPGGFLRRLAFEEPVTMMHLLNPPLDFRIFIC